MGATQLPELQGVIHQVSISKGGVPKLGFRKRGPIHSDWRATATATRSSMAARLKALLLVSLEDLEAVRAEGYPRVSWSIGENLTDQRHRLSAFAKRATICCGRRGHRTHDAAHPAARWMFIIRAPDCDSEASVSTPWPRPATLLAGLGEGRVLRLGNSTWTDQYRCYNRLGGPCGLTGWLCLPEKSTLGDSRHAQVSALSVAHSIPPDLQQGLEILLSRLGRSAGRGVAAGAVLRGESQRIPADCLDAVRPPGADHVFSSSEFIRKRCCATRAG